MSIKIKTALDSGIYKSDGGGEIRTHYTWNTGPRNLLCAIKTLTKHSDSMTRSYGNVGHSGSWIEIDGIRIRSDEIEEMAYETDPDNYKDFYHLSAKTRTQWCKNLIASVQNGSLVEDRINAEAAYDEYETARNNAYYEGVNGKKFTGDQFNFSDYRDGQRAREAHKNHY